MDAFFVAVELQRRPELAGQPVVVGGAGERGVVAAASYEARRYGIRSAMPSTQARRRCPHAVFLPGDHERYEQVSREVHRILRSYTPLVEGIALDEAFLDVTGSLRLFGDGETIAHALRRRVADELGLTCSVGVAPSKLLAKLASEAAKPRATATGVLPGRGVVVVAPGQELAFLHPHPVEALWGVGPATLERLHRLGIATVGDLAELPEAVLVRTLGVAHGRHLHLLALGIDTRPVEPDRPARSIGHEETFAHDLHDREALGRVLTRQADAVGVRLREHGLSGRTVSIKVRFAGFHTITRSLTLPEPVSSGPAIGRAAHRLLAAVDPGPGVRLLGVSVSGLVSGGGEQLRLWDGAGEGAHDGDAGWDQASRAMDDIRRRYGPTAIGPASTVEPGRGLRVTRRRDQAWGPDRHEDR